jgi:hypothetical protein
MMKSDNSDRIQCSGDKRMPADFFLDVITTDGFAGIIRRFLILMGGDVDPHRRSTFPGSLADTSRRWFVRRRQRAIAVRGAPGPRSRRESAY